MSKIKDPVNKNSGKDKTIDIENYINNLNSYLKTMLVDNESPPYEKFYDCVYNLIKLNQHEQLELETIKICTFFLEEYMNLNFVGFDIKSDYSINIFLDITNKLKRLYNLIAKFDKYYIYHSKYHCIKYNKQQIKDKFTELIKDIIYVPNFTSFLNVLIEQSMIKSKEELFYKDLQENILIHYKIIESIYSKNVTEMYKYLLEKPYLGYLNYKIEKIEQSISVDISKFYYDYLNFIKVEQSFVENCLNLTSFNYIKEIIESSCIVTNLSKILNRGYFKLIDEAYQNKQNESLSILIDKNISLLYDILKPNIIWIHFIEFNKQKLQESLVSIFKIEDKNLLIHNLILLKSVYIEIYNKFDKLDNFINEVNKQFDETLSRFDESPMWYAAYLNSKTINSLKISKSDYSDEIKKCLIITSNITDKSKLEYILRSFLLSRILNLLCRQDLERILMEEFRKQLGNVWTDKLDAIIAALEKSRQCQAEFSEIMRSVKYEQNIETSTVDFKVKYFPKSHFNHQFYNDPMWLISLPDLKQIWDLFVQYFMMKHDLVQIQLNLHYGSLELIFNATHKTFKIICTTLQAAILLMFNLNQNVTVNEVVQKTGITESMVKTSVMQLEKSEIICKRKSKSNPSESIYSANIGLSSIKRNLNLINYDYSYDINNYPYFCNSKNAVTIDWNSAIEAKVVKVMKRLRETTRDNLRNEIYIDFKEHMNEFENVIQSLTKRDFIEINGDVIIYVL